EEKAQEDHPVAGTQEGLRGWTDLGHPQAAAPGEHHGPSRTPGTSPRAARSPAPAARASLSAPTMRSSPLPVPTRAPRPSTSDTTPGAAGTPSLFVTTTRRRTSFFRPSWVKAPGHGAASARTRLWMLAAGADQLIRPSSGVRSG